MRELPIIFSAPMIQAILDDRKSQTRRILKPQPSGGLKDNGNGTWMTYVPNDEPDDDTIWKCPYGQAGDLLWVKESYRLPERFDNQSPSDVKNGAVNAGYETGPACPVSYEADGFYTVWGDSEEADYEMFGSWGRLRSPRFMPKWTARLWLEVIGVRVERVQEISEEDAEAEGLFNSGGCHLWHCDFTEGFHPDQGCKCGYRSPEEEFATLWDSINGKKPGCSWGSDPWVWVIEFRRVKP